MHMYHRGGPYVVHCSAGIGRSGVLMAVDTALCRMEQAQNFDMFTIVSDLRRQRYGMIQTQVCMHIFFQCILLKDMFPTFSLSIFSLLIF